MFSTDLGAMPLPARGLSYSVTAHVLLWVVTLYVPWSYWLPPEPHLASSRSIEAHEVLLLPNLEPMDSDAPAAQAGSLGANKQPEDDAPAPSLEAKANRGVVYRGPQLIVSNPPHPDNFVQTIRQPDIAAPKLPSPLRLPPMISIAPFRPVFVPPAPAVASENRPAEVIPALPVSLPQQQPKVEAPKLPLSVAASADTLRAVANATPPAPMPTLAQPAPPAGSGNDAHNILIVNAIAVPDLKPSTIPPGELHGAFTVLPEGSTIIGSAGGGPDSKGAPGMGNASGSSTRQYGGTGDRAAGGTGEGKIARADVGSGTGTGNGSAGSGNASTGVSVAGRHGSGSGSGRGSGNSPFPAIMIQGGSGGGTRGSVNNSGTAKPQTSYGITIMASGSSGGGFRDFGVFRDETSYTVYLDMADAGAYGQSWTLQYALGPLSARNSPVPNAHGLLVPPYATVKSLAHFPSDAARRGRGGTIVVFGIINPEGKFENLRIMQTPDPDLNQPLLESLRKWTFQAAEIDGTRVPVKVLLGVPVNSVPVE
jgi:TonB family protein